MLVIIGVLLAFTLLVLFVPVRYRISAVFPGNNITAKFHWLAGIVSLRIRYPSDGNKAYGFRIFGIPFNWLFRRIMRDTDDSDADKDNDSDAEDSNVNIDNNVNEDNEIVRTYTKRKKRGDYQQNGSEQRKNKKKSKKSNSMESGISNIRVLAKKIADGIKNAAAAIQNPDNIAAVRVIKDRFILLLKHLKPKKIYANMVIGTGDPCNTGLLFGGISILIGLWPGDYTLVPDFDNKVIEGNVYCKGRVRVSVLLYHVIRVMLDDTVMKAWKHKSKGKRRKAGNGGNK